jgi:hypothetical protein
MQLFRENDRLGEGAHWLAKPATLTAQVEVGLFLGEAVAVLQYPLGTLDDFSRFEGSLHLESLGHQPRILYRQ